MRQKEATHCHSMLPCLVYVGRRNIVLELLSQYPLIMIIITINTSLFQSLIRRGNKWFFVLIAALQLIGVNKTGHGSNKLIKRGQYKSEISFPYAFGQCRESTIYNFLAAESPFCRGKKKMTQETRAALYEKSHFSPAPCEIVCETLLLLSFKLARASLCYIPLRTARLYSQLSCARH